MPNKNESMLRGEDASHDATTELSFDPPPFHAGNVVIGAIASAGDEDWIAIDLTAGNTYTITVAGRATTPDDPDTTDVDESEGTDLVDSVLTLRDSKGGLIRQNDDIDAAKGMLLSQLRFTPEAGSGTQTYYLSVSGSDANPGAGDDVTGGYTVSVTQAAVLLEGVGADIEGNENPNRLTGTDNSESLAGLGGNDTLDGGGGDDTLTGGPGNDLLIGGPGGDRLNGGPGIDTISYRLSPMGVTINLGDGTARGGHADGDILPPRHSIENIQGSDHPDALTASNGDLVANSLWGYGGNDTLRGRDGGDTLDGGAGDDELDGGDENDTLIGGPGMDTLIGGRGTDVASYMGSEMGVTVRLHSGQAMGGDAEGDTWGDMVTVEYDVPAEDPRDPAVTALETVPDIINLIGSDMADILAGDSRVNTLMGMGGNDKLYGGPGGGDDNLQGGRGDDMVFGGRGNDTLHGGAGNDMLHGGPGADTFDGGAGNDMIYADLADLGNIDGGENPRGLPDMDTLSFQRLVDMGVGTAADVFTLGTDAENIERVIGTDEDDFITGADESATNAGDASEEIEGGDGGDTLMGGDGGGDTVSYENSDRRVRVDLGGSNTATTQDDSTDASVSGGHATGDNIYGFENIKGSDHGDVLTAITGAAGTPGSTLWGLGGDDSLTGGVGNDTLEGGAGADELDGGFTASTATATEPARNTQVNILSYALSDAAVTVNLAAVSASGGHAEGDEIETYEYTFADGTEIDVSTFINVTGSRHDDRLTGDLFGNMLSGGVGDDSLRGGAGGDTLIGGPGADRLDGGEDRNEENNEVPAPGAGVAGSGVPAGETSPASEDWAAYRAATAGVTVDLDANTGTAGEAMGDTLSNIELIWGSRLNDTFIAGERADVIHGDGGSDTVSYHASKHGVRVVLVTSDDSAQFAGADDTFTSPSDTIVATWRAGSAARPTSVQADDGLTTTKSYAEGDQLESIENVTGSRRDDVITGDGVPNVLMGGDGNDQLVGQGEDDTLHGGAGNDILGRRLAQPARDLNEDGDEIDIGEQAVDAIDDDAGNDMMDGGAGNDKLYGGAGNDTLNGGPGNDDLQGDAVVGTNTGADVFVFAPGDTGSDVIRDLSNTDGVALTDGTASTVAGDGTVTLGNNGTGDKIDLSAFNIDAEDLPRLLEQRGDNVILTLEAYGGGRVTIENVTVEGLTQGTGPDDLHLIHDDNNGMAAGVGIDGTDGVFIL